MNKLNKSLNKSDSSSLLRIVADYLDTLFRLIVSWRKSEGHVKPWGRHFIFDNVGLKYANTCKYATRQVGSKFQTMDRLCYTSI